MYYQTKDHSQQGARGFSSLIVSLMSLCLYFINVVHLQAILKYHGECWNAKTEIAIANPTMDYFLAVRKFWKPVFSLAIYRSFGKFF